METLHAVINQLKLQKEENNQFRKILIQTFTGPKSQALQDMNQLQFHFEEMFGDFHSAIQA